MQSPIQRIRQHVHPGLRGAFFYAAYWGAIGLYEPFIGIYFLQAGLTDAQIGWMASVLPLCTLVINPLVSRLADRMRRRVIFLAIACAGYGLALTLFALPGLVPTFAALLVIVGLFSAFRGPGIPLADSLIAQMVLRYRLDFGSLRLWGSMLFTLAAIGSGVIWERSGFETMFLASGLAFAPVVAAALLLEEVPHVPAELDAVERSTGAEKNGFVLDPGVLFLLGGTFLVVAALFMSITFGGVFVKEIGGSQALIGAMTGFAALGEVPGMLFGSRVARRLGDTNTLIVAYVLVALGLAGYTVNTSSASLLFFAVLRGLGFGMLLVCTVMILNSRAPRGFTSTYQGILAASCWGLAPLLGGPVSGWLYGTYGPAALFLFAAALSLLACLLVAPTYRAWKRVPAVTN
jgi:PPP family 3-phenylpropionic acid transporter